MMWWIVFFTRRNIETGRYETVKRHVFTYELMMHYRKSEDLCGKVIHECTPNASRIIYGGDEWYW